MSIKRQSVIISAIFLVNTILSFAAQIFITRIFGASVELENFLLAVTIPTLLVTVVYGTINDSFLPSYTKVGPKTAAGDAFFSSHVVAFVLISSAVSAALALLSPWLLPLVFDAAGSNAQLQRFFVTLLSIFPIAVLIALYGSRAYAEKRILAFPFAQMVGAAVNLLFVLAFYTQLGIWAVIIAFFLNTLIQILFLWRPSVFEVQLSKTKQTLFALLPLIFAAIALRSDSVIIRSISSGMSPGSVVHINLVVRMLSMGAGIATIGLQTALFPRLVEKLQDRIDEQAALLVWKAKIASVVLGLGVFIVGVIIAPIVFKVLLVGETFTIQDWQATISYLPYFALPTIGWAAVTTWLQPLYALRMQLWVGVIGISSLALALGSYSVLQLMQFSPIVVMAGCVTVLLFSSCCFAEILWQRELLRRRI